ncbi:TonB family protein [Methylobacterium sp. OAE515]|uniref:energy transducer TonB n=1 Tax=Methylobacterium sp. OAE515 TaxID=2817895 RepID=UPI00178AC71D
MPSRMLAPGIVAVGLLLVPWAAPARGAEGPRVRAWLSDLITRIDAVDRAGARPRSGRRAGTVVVHVEIAADGSLQRIEIERSSGVPDLDRRALRAVQGAVQGKAAGLVQGAGPLAPPPAALLGGAGVADLSVPVDLGR